MVIPQAHLKLLAQSAGYAAAGLATKAVGSVYRVKDDWHAPQEVRDKTFKREGTLLGVSFAFLTAINVLFTQVLDSKLARKFKNNDMKFVETIVRLALAAPAFAVAEYISRKTGPRDIWDKPLETAKTATTALSQNFMGLQHKVTPIKAQGIYFNPLSNTVPPVYYNGSTKKLHFNA